MSTNINISEIDLTNKVVVLNPFYYKEPYVFLCKGGFGCSPKSMGNCVGGTFLIDNEDARVERYQVIRLATEQEIKDKRISYETLVTMLRDEIQKAKDLNNRLNKLNDFVTESEDLDVIKNFNKNIFEMPIKLE